MLPTSGVHREESSPAGIRVTAAVRGYGTQNDSDSTLPTSTLSMIILSIRQRNPLLVSNTFARCQVKGTYYDVMLGAKFRSVPLCQALSLTFTSIHDNND